MENTFIYNLSETEYLVFKSQRDHFELFSEHDELEHISTTATLNYKKAWVANSKAAQGHTQRRAIYSRQLTGMRSLMQTYLNSGT